ncbi:hypothetical protein A3G54_01605 [Candidatus Giovannonibacteria bacterium RIFCSPLOWO2_12_FULL_44_15]|uniref:Uncharacterized protein n=1 Tax=Candidatus Giovannonibacteria bacterium RIFCSPLOWO2_12_FULL_44_15 TaxID=1798364 RepID=A0A1F5XZY6_9BACT|nr:MAG: hypothetical protein A3E62_02170 [Candidatus Giovannonibacteria bacterium RIFCSPHIGHO2_12_FULL_44_29]OGF93419.1 MAG: hypothetical protein A3G54_01605 [Candidatus Giovannonibacteria bacterium RIFCSPLOWO2_12_FULL_44_15]
MIKTLLELYAVVVFLHMTDLNPIWLWGWYREVANTHPGFFLLNFLLALCISAFFQRRDRTQEPPISRPQIC